MGKVSSLRLAAAGVLLAAASFAQAQPNRDTAALVTLSASGPGQYASADQSNSVNRSAKCVVNLTTVTGGYVQVSLQGKDQASASYYDIANTPALTGGSRILTVGSGLLASSPIGGGLTANENLPQTWRVVANVIGGASAAASGTIGCSTIE